MNYRAQAEMLVANMLDLSLTADLTKMENPIFARSEVPDTSVWEYRNEERGIHVLVTPSTAGRPTIFDKDLLMYCIGQVVEGMNRGREVSERVQIVAQEFLHVTGWQLEQDVYDAMLAAAERLMGVVITVESDGEEMRKQRIWQLADIRGLVNSASVSESSNGQTVTLELVLSDWIFEAIGEKWITDWTSSSLMDPISGAFGSSHEGT